MFIVLSLVSLHWLQVASGWSFLLGAELLGACVYDALCCVCAEWCVRSVDPLLWTMLWTGCVRAAPLVAERVIPGSVCVRTSVRPRRQCTLCGACRWAGVGLERGAVQG